ncbi:hypothetical protein CLAIMM_01744 [Cladophialophora immunda]|nr:hypothetical protein CLAIMM_01744 [Cladophialophora immunda]
MLLVEAFTSQLAANVSHKSEGRHGVSGVRREMSLPQTMRQFQAPDSDSRRRWCEDKQNAKDVVELNIIAIGRRGEDHEVPRAMACRGGAVTIRAALTCINLHLVPHSSPSQNPSAYHG